MKGRPVALLPARQQPSDDVLWQACQTAPGDGGEGGKTKKPQSEWCHECGRGCWPTKRPPTCTVLVGPSTDLGLFLMLERGTKKSLSVASSKKKQRHAKPQHRLAHSWMATIPLPAGKRTSAACVWSWRPSPPCKTTRQVYVNNKQACQEWGSPLFVSLARRPLAHTGLHPCWPLVVPKSLPPQVLGLARPICQGREELCHSFCARGREERERGREGGAGGMEWV